MPAGFIRRALDGVPVQDFDFGLTTRIEMLRAAAQRLDHDVTMPLRRKRSTPFAIVREYAARDERVRLVCMRLPAPPGSRKPE